MNRKVLAAIFSAAVLVVIVMTVILYHLSGFSSFVSMGCTAEGYEQKAGTGYLTIGLEGSPARDSAVIRVSQEALQKELSEGELSDIIGVNMVLEIPAHVARKNNIDRNTDVFGLLYASDAYDKYLTITAVFRR